MKIAVTADDILYGVPRHCSLCPVALALHRVFLGGPSARWPRVAVDPFRIVVEQGFDLHKYQTPLVVREFIDRYDDQTPLELAGVASRFQPFEFELEEGNPSWQRKFAELKAALEAKP